MIEAGCIEELLGELQSIEPQPRIITIDGWPNAGKSTLATNLAALMGAVHLDLDTFLIKDQGVFVEAIRYEELQSAIDISSAPLIISGVCMLAVLERISLAPDCKIYLKRMASWGWADQDEIEGQMLEIVAEALGKQVSEYALPVEVRAYHTSHVPHENADIAFLRYECPD